MKLEESHLIVNKVNWHEGKFYYYLSGFIGTENLRRVNWHLKNQLFLLNSGIINKSNRDVQP